MAKIRIFSYKTVDWCIFVKKGADFLVLCVAHYYNAYFVKHINR